MKQVITILSVVALFLVWALPANADYLTSVMVPGLVGGNSIVDDSVEGYFNTGGNTVLVGGTPQPSFGKGDVILGITEINTVNSVGVNTHVYAITDLQVAGLVPNGSNFDVFF